MFQKEFPKEEPVVLKEISRSHLSLVVPVDQYDGKSFNLNDAGWPRNDIAQIARAQSLEEYNAVLARLVDVKKDGGLPDDLTDDEAFGLIKPRYAQSANEVERFAEITNETVMSRLDAAYRKSLGLDVKSSGKKSASVESAESSPTDSVQ